MALLLSSLLFVFDFVMDFYAKFYILLGKWIAGIEGIMD
jgi:hypothetical protein